MLGPRSIARVPFGNSVNNWVNKIKSGEREKKVQRELENAFKVIAALGKYEKLGAAATAAAAGERAT